MYVYVYICIYPHVLNPKFYPRTLSSALGCDCACTCALMRVCVGVCVCVCMCIVCDVSVRTLRLPQEYAC